MPNKKQRTTLVTQDELVETVTGLVTEGIKEDLEARFARFERALERLAGPDTNTPAAATVTQPIPEAQNTESTPVVSNDSIQNTNTPLQNNPQSSIDGFVASTATSVTPQTPYFQPTPNAPLRMPHPTVAPAASAVNINTATWGPWFRQQQPANPPLQAPRPTFPMEAYHDMSLEAQVRHIMNSAPHQLKCTVTQGFFPFKYITRGPEKKKLSFNTLTLAEHIFGMFCMLDDPDFDPGLKPYIVAHMREVAEDASEFEWPNVRRWSEEVFNLVAERRLPQGWGSAQKIQNLRTGMSKVDSARLPSHKDFPNKKFAGNAGQHDNLRGGPPCQNYNSSQGCPLQSGHMLNGKRQVHVCSYCLSNIAAVHPHPESHCRTKQRHAPHF